MDRAQAHVRYRGIGQLKGYYAILTGGHFGADYKLTVLFPGIYDAPAKRVIRRSYTPYQRSRGLAIDDRSGWVFAG